MSKSIRDIPKKRRGRPSTGGRRDGVLVRFEADQFESLDAWIAKQKEDDLSRPEAIRRLVELGLGKTAPPVTVTSTAKGSAERAKELAGKTIDSMVGPAASAEEKAVRKRRLIKGPEEFRGSRIDRARTKDK